MHYHQTHHLVHLRLGLRQVTLYLKIGYNRAARMVESMEYVDELISEYWQYSSHNGFGKLPPIVFPEPPVQILDVTKEIVAQTNEVFEEYIRSKAETAYHPSCTLKMGVDNMAVVDQKLKVHGVENLRVVDASVMPEITSGNPVFSLNFEITA